MKTLERKIDFAALISVTNANANGDPLGGNRPRQDYEGFGEMSDVCIKRKIRNRMQDLGYEIFVKSDDRCDDGKKTLKDRTGELMKIKDPDEFAKKACEAWLDVRAFGQVFAFSDKSFAAKSVGVRGPVSVHQAVSCDPISIESVQITKSVSNEKAEGKGSDTMGMKHYVRYGLYKLKGSINVQLSEKTGFSEEDSEILKECLRTLFVNDSSSARPEGSMEVVKLYWWEHNCKDGQYSSAKVHRSLHVKLADGVTEPKSFDDYIVTLDELPGLSCMEIDGV